jgi:hypothetical protein
MYLDLTAACRAREAERDQAILNFTNTHGDLFDKSGASKTRRTTWNQHAMRLARAVELFRITTEGDRRLAKDVAASEPFAPTDQINESPSSMLALASFRKDPSIANAETAFIPLLNDGLGAWSLVDLQAQYAQQLEGHEWLKPSLTVDMTTRLSMRLHRELSAVTPFFEVLLSPSNLMAAAWAQLVQAVVRGAKVGWCEHCGVAFEVGRGAAKTSRRFCTDVHRVAWHRAQKPKKTSRKRKRSR